MSKPSGFTEARRAGQTDALKQMLREDPPLALALDGVDGKLAVEGSPGAKEDHSAIVELLQSRGAKVIGRIESEE